MRRQRNAHKEARCRVSGVDAAESVADVQYRGRVVWLTMFGWSLSGKTPWVPGRVALCVSGAVKGINNNENVARASGFVFGRTRAIVPKVVLVLYKYVYCSVLQRRTIDQLVGDV